MTSLGAVSAAWTAAEAALPLGWRLASVLPARARSPAAAVVSDEPRLDWCALVEDEVGTLYDGWGQFPLPGADEPGPQAARDTRADDRLAPPCSGSASFGPKLGELSVDLRHMADGFCNPPGG